ncbi:MAG: hypothetical protein IKJ26_03465, partial [Clostridia bacterium]|nr:hypothetical protein [Clostridia bacterium]
QEIIDQSVFTEQEFENRTKCDDRRNVRNEKSKTQKLFSEDSAVEQIGQKDTNNNGCRHSSNGIHKGVFDARNKATILESFHKVFKADPVDVFAQLGKGFYFQEVELCKGKNDCQEERKGNKKQIANQRRGNECISDDIFLSLLSVDHFFTHGDFLFNSAYPGLLSQKRCSRRREPPGTMGLD